MLIRFVFFLFAVTSSTTLCGQDVVDTWQYTFRKPADRWNQVEFEPSGWKTGHGGFGTYGTPGTRIGTVWSTKAIWLRKEFTLQTIPAKPALYIHHDEDCEVFLNGQSVLKRSGFVTEYKVIELAPDQIKSLKLGKNVMAVQCRQTGGGQSIDVHLIDAISIPKLPEPQRDTRPFASDLITSWGSEVRADNAWREYPRPQMKRKEWTNLNGHWDYAITSIDQKSIPSRWDGRILVPYCLESKLGGVQRLLDGREALWYHQTLELPQTSGRSLIHFEAVDYRCEVFLNGKSLLKHQGGNTPFSVDISSAAKEVGTNDLVVRVEDETEKFQLRGKQVLNAHGIWYTQVSGIWQTVWLEQVPSTYIEKIKLETRADSGEIDVRLQVQGPSAGSFEVTVKDGQTNVVEAKTTRRANC